MISVFRYYAGIADSDPGRLVDTWQPSVVSRIVYEPVGVCALITPLTTIRLVELLVEAPLHDDLVAEVAARAERIRIGNGLDPESETGPLVSAAHRAKIEAYVEAGLAEGAALVAGGRRPDDPELANGYVYRPTVFDGCRADMRIVREETFGPLLTVETFETEADALALANDTAGAASLVHGVGSVVFDYVVVGAGARMCTASRRNGAPQNDH